MKNLIFKFIHFFTKSDDQPHNIITLKGIEYLINEEEKTASVTRCQSNATEIIIPRSINHKSNECIVRSISKKAFEDSVVRSVSFESNSELLTIGENAFSRSNLASIVIQSHVTQICECAFEYCEQLSLIEFEPNSELQTIEDYAFSDSKLSSIVISSHVTQICRSVFSDCEQLSRVEFEPNSKLIAIGENAFSRSKLSSIVVPSHVTQICEFAFSYCEQLS
ncbi:hypothetical protein M9Y10_035836 [Tritrichomonas musculus]|uniref:Surface antigen BspA-like protein n=1 Tax=Tritrichomonas musculus TaxID=1915356 RepID=A0ABR2GVE1_9EUKA